MKRATFAVLIALALASPGFAARPPVRRPGPRARHVVVHRPLMRRLMRVFWYSPRHCHHDRGRHCGYTCGWHYGYTRGRHYGHRHGHHRGWPDNRWQRGWPDEPGRGHRGR